MSLSATLAAFTWSTAAWSSVELTLSAAAAVVPRDTTPRVTIAISGATITSPSPLALRVGGATGAGKVWAATGGAWRAVSARPANSTTRRMTRRTGMNTSSRTRVSAASPKPARGTTRDKHLTAADAANRVHWQGSDP